METLEANAEARTAGAPEPSGMLSHGLSGVPLPRYALPNTSHSLPQYLGSEGEAIQRAFHTGNYDMIHALPDKLEHLSVIRKRQELQKQVRDMMAMVGKDGLLPSQKGATDARGLFHGFEYQPTDYVRQEVERRAEVRQLDKGKVEEIAGGKAFIPNGMAGKGSGRRLKFEDMFGEEDFRYPYLGGELDEKDDDLLSESWIQSSYDLGPRFAPNGPAGLHAPAGAVNPPTKRLLPELLAALKGILAADWEGSAFDLLLDSRGRVVVQFDLTTVDSRDGLAAYMNMLVKSNALITKYLVSRVPESWNKERTPGRVDFTMRPPWVPNAAINQTFMRLHPEYEATGIVSTGDAGASQGLHRDLK